jgi:hypothetical protein
MWTRNCETIRAKHACPDSAHLPLAPRRGVHRRHRIDQQLCRWLLLSCASRESDEMTMTQQLIANMLGVRREGVTEAAGKLQKAGIIRYSRGRIAVLDRERLEERCCECYSVVRNEFDRLLAAPLRESA